MAPFSTHRIARAHFGTPPVSSSDPSTQAPTTEAPSAQVQSRTGWNPPLAFAVAGAAFASAFPAEAVWPSTWLGMESGVTIPSDVPPMDCAWWSTPPSAIVPGCDGNGNDCPPADETNGTCGGGCERNAAPQSAFTLASINIIWTTIDCIVGRAVGSCAQARVMTPPKASRRGGSLMEGRLRSTAT